MTVTHCLGPFALRLSRLPLQRAAWKALIESQPEQCPHNCGRSCRELCREYAKVQRKCVERKKGVALS
jgi:hypothetical protein